MKKIQSRDNPFYKSLLRLSASSRARRAERITILDGIHLLETYGATGQVARALIVRDSSTEAPEVLHIVKSFNAEQMYSLGDALFDAVAQVTTPTGIMALVSTPPPLDPPTSVGDAVLIEEIQDPGNLGSIFRSAAAAGLINIFLSRKSIFAWSPKVLRAGMGAHFMLNIREDVDLPALLKRREGIALATDVSGGNSIYETNLRNPVAWIFGNEGAGVSASLMQAADLRVHIPMPGRANSLNVAAAAAVCLFEQTRQRT